jgi:preprotein translocase subunit SecD
VAAAAQYRPGRVLLILAVIVLALSVWAFWPTTPNTPKLGLDLQGGTQVILDPQPIGEDAEITEEQLQQSVEIIRARVNGLGVSEADISIQGSGNEAVLVVSVPNVSQDRIVELVGRTALLNFRPVSQILDPQPVGTDGDPIASDDEASNDKDASPEEETEGAEVVQSKTNNAKFLTQVLALDCTDPVNQSGGTPDDPELWLGTCDRDPQRQSKYILEPAFIRGENVETAAAEVPQQGAGGWVVTLDFDSEGAAQLAEVSGRIVALSPPKNQFAIVLDGVVVSAPSFEQQILGGSAQITGNFTTQEAQDLANVLKFGALPITLEVQAVESVSATLGGDQLKAGLLAGALGLALVALYLLFYYRALGIVAGVSLVLAGWIAYCAFVILGNTIGFALTLAGIAGAIVAIGITADSFVVYFERLRDEIREGKSLRRAADDGWARARRTLLAADFVSFLAAAVLYWLSVGNVRGFAFALGLTTIVDVVVAFWFTRPVVSIMTRSKWMQRGGSFTGVSPERLGVDSLAGKQRPKTSARRRRRGTTATGTSTESGGGDAPNPSGGSGATMVVDVAGGSGPQDRGDDHGDENDRRPDGSVV